MGWEGRSQAEYNICKEENILIIILLPIEING